MVDVSVTMYIESRIFISISIKYSNILSECFIIVNANIMCILVLGGIDNFNLYKMYLELKIKIVKV